MVATILKLMRLSNFIGKLLIGKQYLQCSNKFDENMLIDKGAREKKAAKKTTNTEYSI